MMGKTKGSRALVKLCLAVLAAGWYGLAQAQLPDRLNFQGFLTGPGGVAITGSQTMVFRLYNVVSGGAALYTETQTLALNNGVFNAVLGSVTPLGLPFDVPYFIGIKVGADAEMTPRQPLVSAPYALRADTADGLAATATLSAIQLTGTIGTTQIANNAVTQAKLSPLSGATAGKVLGTDGSNAATESDTIRIGSGSAIGQQNKFFVAGVFGIVPQNASRSAVYVDNAVQLGVLSSSRRYKDDIVDMDAASSDLMRLRPVTFHYKSDRDRSAQALQHGLVAEEVAEVYPGLVTHTPDGQVESVLYQFLPAMLLNEYQKQQRTIQVQAETMSRPAVAISRQMAAMSQQAARIAELEQDRRVQLARIGALESQAAEIAMVKQQIAQIVQRREQSADLTALQTRLGVK